jgi:hypothetical protein
MGLEPRSAWIYKITSGALMKESKNTSTLTKNLPITHIERKWIR